MYFWANESAPGTHDAVQESQVFGAWGAGPFDRFDPRLCCLGWQLQLNKWRVRRQKGFRPSLNPNWMCRSSHVSKNWTSPKENQSAVQSGTISELCMRGRRYLLDSASAATQSSNIPPMVYAGNNFQVNTWQSRTFPSCQLYSSGIVQLIM